MRMIRIGLIAALICAATAKIATAQTVERYQKLCDSAEGRNQLMLEMDEASKADLTFQAQASGLAPQAHIRNSIEQICAHYVPGSVIPTAPSQAWKFSVEDIGAPLPGESHKTLRAASSPPRCGPNCSGGLKLEFTDPRWQVCRLRYKTNYENRGKTYWRSLPGAKLEVRPASWIDGSRFQGFTVKVEAADNSFIEVTDIEMDVVDANLSLGQRQEMNCLIPDAAYVEHVGSMECKQQRSKERGARDRDDCNVIHSAIGARRFLRSSLMRKVIISKPDGDAGEEIIVKRVNGSITGQLTLKPGQRYELLTPPTQTQWRDFSVEIITTGKGSDEKSRYSVFLEWYNG